MILVLLNVHYGPLLEVTASRHPNTTCDDSNKIVLSGLGVLPFGITNESSQKRLYIIQNRKANCLVV